MARLEGRKDPLQPRQLTERAQGLSVGNRLVARSAGVPEVGVLGTDARVVEPGGDRMGSRIWP